MGYYGKITEIIQTYRKRESTVKIVTSDGREVRTIVNYLFALGREKPSITIMPQQLTQSQ